MTLKIRDLRPQPELRLLYLTPKLGYGLQKFGFEFVAGAKKARAGHPLTLDPKP